VRAGIEVSSHDPLWNYADVSSHRELFLGYLPILSKDPHIRPKVVELPPKVVKRITFEGQITDINNNRLQEVVDK
jgi:hypothetical protein